MARPPLWLKPALAVTLATLALPMAGGEGYLTWLEPPPLRFTRPPAPLPPPTLAPAPVATPAAMEPLPAAPVPASSPEVPAPIQVPPPMADSSDPGAPGFPVPDLLQGLPQPNLAPDPGLLLYTPTPPSFVAPEMMVRQFLYAVSNDWRSAIVVAPNFVPPVIAPAAPQSRATYRVGP